MNVSLFSTRPCPIWDPDVPNNGGGNSGGNNKDNTSEQILSYIQYEKIELNILILSSI